MAAAACDAGAAALSACPEPGGGGRGLWAVRGASELRLWHLELPLGFRARSVLARVHDRVRLLDNFAREG